jgi:hypothetical protein
MRRSIIAFVAGLGLGGAVMMQAAPVPSRAQAPGLSPSPSSVTQLRVYTIDKGRLDDFANAWRAGVYPLRLKMGYRIPFAAKIPQTNQFVWILASDGPEAWEKKEAAYYASDDRKRLSPDPAQWIARPEQLTAQPLVDVSSKRP